MTIFGHFFSLSLLSYIEIYIEYSGNLKKNDFRNSKTAKKIPKKITVLLGSWRSPIQNT